MMTKIIAARTAVFAGVPVVLSHGAFPERIIEFLDFLKDDLKKNRPLCTVFEPPAVSVSASTMNAHRRWLLALPVRGALVLDKGACKAVTVNKTSLLAVGVKEVKGNFFRDECVSLVSAETGTEIARGLMNLDSEQVSRIKGLHSDDLDLVLGFSTCPELIYRSNICILAACSDN
jgi:glutamate 5-kinase